MDKRNIFPTIANFKKCEGAENMVGFDICHLTRGQLYYKFVLYTMNTPSTHYMFVRNNHGWGGSSYLLEHYLYKLCMICCSNLNYS